MSIFLLGINSIVGSGIFILPANAFRAFGVYSLWALLFTIVLTILFGMCFAEMSGLHERDGGVYVYAKETFGNFIGFNIGIFNFFSAIMTCSTAAVGFTQVLSAFFPIFHYGSIYSFILPPLLIFLTATITILGIRKTTWSNNVITIAKLIPLFLFCLVGIFFIKGYHFNFSQTTATVYTLNSFISAVLIFFYAFTGFEMIPLAAKTMENPTKNLPKAIIVTLLFVGFFYTLILFVSIGLLGPALGQSDNPIADAFSTILGSFGFYFIWLGSLISIFGLLLATSFEAPRALSPLAEDGFLHSFFAVESQQSVPIISVLTMVFFASMISITGNFEVLLKSLSFILLIMYLVPACAVLVTRKQKKSSSYSMPFFPYTPILTIIITIYLLYKTPFTELIYGFSALIVSIILYFIYARPLKKRTLS